MKTNAENLRLFEEARSLRESIRNSLHDKAGNFIKKNDRDVVKDSDQECRKGEIKK